MNDNNLKEVRFDIHCKTCKYERVEGFRDPCDECLESAMNEGTEKPVCWEEKE